MKAFFNSFTLARWIIVVSLFFSILLGWSGWYFHQRRTALETALVKQVPDLAVELQTLSKQYSKLYKDAEREGLKAQDDPASYIRKIGSDPTIEIGQLSINTPPAQEFIKGVADRKITIKPQNVESGFSRVALANFFWKLESESKRVRVTEIHMEPAQKGVKPQDTLNDRWKWNAEATSRAKKDATTPQ